VDDKGVSGAQGRLHNLGVDPGGIDGKLDEECEAALKELQRVYPEDLEETGKLDDETGAKLKEAHGC
jgi:hypothetical protein